MTKKELLKRFADCKINLETESRTDYDHNERKDKIMLFNDYYSLIDAMLMFCPDEFSIDGLSSLSEFECKGGLENFIISSNIDEIKNRLNALSFEIKTLANMFANKNSNKLRNAATALTLRNEWLNERQNKNHKIIFPLFIAGFVLLSLVVVVFSCLDAAKYFAEDTVMAKICAIISSVAGALDAVNGIAFFVYERHDDKKKKVNQDSLEQAIYDKVTIKNSGNIIKVGNGSNVHIGDSRLTADDENQLDMYIIKNSRNKIHAKKKANLDIGDN